MLPFLSPQISELSPYQPGEQPDSPNLIKLNTNENPYPPSPMVGRAINETLHQLHLYPDPEAEELHQAAAKFHRVERDQVFAANSSDEVLAFSFLAFFRHSQPILLPDISYGFYRVWCKLFNIKYRQITLDDNLQLQTSDYQGEHAGIIFANPNSPTGMVLSVADVEQLLRQNSQQVVVIDEAYIDFCNESVVSLIDQYANLVVVQTMSKSRSLAGIRLGFAFAQAPLIEALQRIKYSFHPYSISKLAIAAGVASFEDDDYFQQCCKRIIKTRTSLQKSLESIGFEVLPPAANFLFVHHPNWPAQEILRFLRSDNILVRHFDQVRIHNYLRISIGSEADTQKLLKRLKQGLDA